jgi:tRNA (uracil-5-)-methyltransferase TRM9
LPAGPDEPYVHDRMASAVAPAAPTAASSLPSSSAAPAVARLAAAVAGGADGGVDADAEAEAYERAHVHGVYEAIAPHFSATRYKPWPAVAAFLHAQQPGSVGLDVGCGNGKYLAVNPSVFTVGSDRSAALVALARSRALSGRVAGEEHAGAQGKKKGAGSEVAVTAKATTTATTETTAAAAIGTTTADASSKPAAAAPAAGPVATDVLVADGLSLPFRDHAADFVICVAVIHHMSTRTRRQEAIRQLLRCVRAGQVAGQASGQVLVYVWALEQGGSRRGWDEGGEQDLLVPWVMKAQQQKGQYPQGKGGSNKGGEPPAKAAPAPAPAPPEAAGGGQTDTNVYQRYYHLYRKGELEEDVLAAGGAVITSGYERDNWWVVAANGASLSRPA